MHKIKVTKIVNGRIVAEETAVKELNQALLKMENLKSLGEYNTIKIYDDFGRLVSVFEKAIERNIKKLESELYA
jgi:hypothetical protein